MKQVTRQVQVQQWKAWSYYGFAQDRAPTYQGGRLQAPMPIGEVRYVVGWIADQMVRLGWTIKVDGKEEWTLKLPDGTSITASPQEEVEKAEKEGNTDLLNNAEASKQVLIKALGWSDDVVRQLATNLFVAGELDYLAEPGKDTKDAEGKTVQTPDSWHVVSVVDPDRNELRDAALHSIRGLWPHPADPSMPDAPLFGVLPILEELDWISRVSRAEMANRLTLRGIMGISEDLRSANPTGSGDFMTDFLAAVAATMQDPTNVAPIGVTGETELIAPSGNGMGGLSFLIPDFPADQKMAAKTEKNIQRLAYGLPIPPEILTGLQAQSRATAFQVEDNSYRAHIEPPALIIAGIPEKALQLLIPGKTIEVEPDPSNLLARRHSVEDVKHALENGAAGFSYYREVLDIPDSAAPTEEDLALLERIKAMGHGADPGAQDPGNAAASEPVTASVGGPTDPPQTAAELNSLGARLAEVDHTLMMEMAGTTVMAAERARDRVGARARTFEGLRKALDSDIPNSLVVTELGIQTVRDTGVPIESIVAESLSSLGQWWEKRAMAAQQTINHILGSEAQIQWSESDLRLSASALIDLCAEHVMDTFDDHDASPLSAESRAEVLTILGGGQ